MTKTKSELESKPHKCNYCENHLKEGEQSVPLAGHGRCKYNDVDHFNECFKCLKNSQNTKRMQEHRKNNSENSKSKILNINKNVAMKHIQPNNKFGNKKNIKHLIEVINDDQMILNVSSAPLENYEKSVSSNEEFHMYVLPPGYPYNIFNEFAKESFMNVYNQARSCGDDLNIQYESFEDGLMKVACLDESSSIWLKNFVATLDWKDDNVEIKDGFKTVFKRDLQKSITLSCCVNQEINDVDFVTYIKSKKIFDTTKWHDIIVNIQPNGKTSINFSVNVESFRKFHKQKFKLRVKNEIVSVAVLDNPFATEFDKYFTKYETVHDIDETLKRPSSVFDGMGVNNEEREKILKDPDEAIKDFSSDIFSLRSDSSNEENDKSEQILRDNMSISENVSPKAFNKDDHDSLSSVASEEFAEIEEMRGLEEKKLDNTVISNKSQHVYAISPLNYPETLITEQYYGILYQILREQLVKTTELGTSEVPSFSSSSFNHGAWIFDCDNHYSTKWLKQHVDQLKFIVNDVPLQVTLFKRFKLFTTINDQKTSCNEFFQLIKNQNINLKLCTNAWEIFKIKKVENNKVRIFIEVDEMSFKKIKSNDYKLFFEFGKIKFFEESLPILF